MKNPKPGIAKNLTTGEEIHLDQRVPPQMYTSVHQWKPVPPDRFLHLLHDYSTADKNLDEFNNGELSSKSFNLDNTATATIWFEKKATGSSVSPPVLMTMSYASGKVICFASTMHGVDVQVVSGAQKWPPTDPITRRPLRLTSRTMSAYIRDVADVSQPDTAAILMSPPKL